jgi:UDP-N-acetylglucosamine acyltransferase
MAGYPLRTVGLNIVGLRRRGYTREQVKPLKEAFRILFKSDLNTSQAVDRVEADIDWTSEVAHLVSFVRNSERGIVK